MPTLTIYREGTPIPDHFYYQAQAFSRLNWYDSDTYDIDLEREELTHIVLAEGKLLISYAQVLWRDIEHDGVIYKCGGLSGVMTYPHFRRRGYGGQVVQAATNLITDALADIALLWTAGKNHHFYGQFGWQPLPNMVTLIGDRNKPEIFDDEGAMMLFISDKGIQGQASFENGSVYVGEEEW